MAIRPCYLEGQEITGAMRAVAIDWLMQVQKEFKLRQETVFMAVNLIDCFLQVSSLQKSSVWDVSLLMHFFSLHDSLNPVFLFCKEHTCSQEVLSACVCDRNADCFQV